MIVDLKEGKFFAEGKFWSSLFTNYGIVLVDEGVSKEYAEKCTDNFNDLPYLTMDALCKAAKEFMLSTMEGDTFGEFSTVSYPKEVLKYIRLIDLRVNVPADPDIIGYQLEFECLWKEDLRLEIDIIGSKVVFLGEYSVSRSFWSDDLTADPGNFITKQ